MRLHALRVQAFLAFAGEERVDFDVLGEDGLFLLQGRTGAGKSALLDAVVFALYGEVAGDRGDRLRSDHAVAGVRTEVELELTLRGRRLRIIRRPPQERPKLRGTGMVEAAHEVAVVELGPDGVELPVAGSPSEARAALEDLLGMTRQQFCQVVLLPQGGFAKFLHAGSQERGDLLRELFDLGRFADVEVWLKRRARDAEGRLGTALRGVRDALSRAAQAAGAELPEDLDRDPEAARRWLDETIVVVEASAATAGAGREAARAVEDRAREALTAGTRLARARDAAAVAERDLAQHLGTRDEQDTRVAAADAARRAEPCAPAITALERAAREQRDAQERAAAARAAAPLETDASPPLFDADGRGEADRLRLRAQGLRRAAGRVGAEAEREARVARAHEGIERLRGQAAAAAARAQAASAQLAALAAERPALVTKAEEARAAVERLPGLEAAAERARDRARAASRRDELARARDEAAQRCAAARTTAVEAREAWLAVWQERLQGMALALAADLQDDEPCPVCGSLEHPAPAGEPGSAGHTTVPDAAREAETRIAAEQAEEAKTAAEELLAARTVELAEAAAIAGDAAAELLAGEDREAARAVAAARLAASAVQEAEAALLTLDARTREQETERREAEVEQATTAAAVRDQEAELADDERLLAEVRGSQPTVAARVAELEALAALADAAVDAVEAEARAIAAADDARAVARRTAVERGFADEAAVRAALLAPAELAVLETEIRAWDETLAERRACATQAAEAVAGAEPAWAAACAGGFDDREIEAAKLQAAGLRAFAGQAPAGLPDPDPEELQRAVAEAQERAADAERLAARSGGRHEELVALRSTLEQRLAEAEPARAESALLHELAALADGSSAANRLSMRLSAYVLAARLEEVAAAASVRLERMSEGRYSLEHADDTGTGNRRGGLDLRVLDAWTGRARRPSSLSGGETFLASLSLALGLADVVTAESGGTRLDTLFVDEGFGSLDDEGTLDQVLDVLEGLREGGRVVGLVSHVGELRARIPVQLRVERGPAGSTVTLVDGARAVA